MLTKDTLSRYRFFSQDMEKMGSLKGKFFNWSIRGTLDYLLELNRSTDVANCQSFNSWSPPRNYSGEIVGSILPMKRDPLGENPFRPRGRHLGVWTSCYDNGESAPLIITTLEILLLQDTPWTISRVAKHAISESRAATLKYLASRRRMVRIAGAPAAGVTSNEIEGMKSFVTSFHLLLLLSNRRRR